MLSPSAIEAIETAVGYTFRDRSLLTQAFTRTSYVNEMHGRGERPQSNEVLEFFGDAALSVAIITSLIGSYSERYAFGIRTKFTEGDFTQIRSHLSDKTNLSHSMRRLGLSQYLLLGEGDRKLGMADQPSVLEDLFESIIGAVYVDSGMDMSAVIGAVSRMLDTSLYFSEGEMISHSDKGALQEFCAAKERRLPPPEYILTEHTTDRQTNTETFRVSVKIGERVYAEGVGKSKKEAESRAASDALRVLSAEYAAAPEQRPTSRTPLSILNEEAAKRGVCPPAVTELCETPASTPLRPEYRAVLAFGGQSAEGVGNSKKSAKQAAAAALLECLFGGDFSSVR